MTPDVILGGHRQGGSEDVPQHPEDLHQEPPRESSGQLGVWAWVGRMEKYLGFRALGFRA